MRIAVVGAEGQLGRELCRQLGDRVIPLTHREIELADGQSVAEAIAAAAPDQVINAAAYNQVDRAEDEPEVAFAVNALGPRNLAIACRNRDIALLHVSTDYVFSGNIKVDSFAANRSLPYHEYDRPEPLSAYGLSKLAGELFVRSLCRRHFVVRTCGLFGPTKQSGMGNFVQTMLRLGRERRELRVVNDQRCSPTSTADLAQAIDMLTSTEEYGLYHAVNSGDATWYEFAGEIFRLAGLNVNLIPIGSNEFGAKAARPSFSVLDCRKLTDVTQHEMPTWSDALQRYLDSNSAQASPQA